MESKWNSYKKIRKRRESKK